MSVLLHHFKKFVRLPSNERGEIPGRSRSVGEARYKKTGRLHTGSDGEVFKGKDSVTGKKVAIKVMNRSEEDCKIEKQILDELGDNCKHCLTSLDCYQVDGFTHIVTPYMENGDLFDYIFEKKNGGDIHTDGTSFFLSVNSALQYLAQLILAVDELHSLGYIHGDIKLENVLVDKKKRLKLADYGRCKTFKTDVKREFDAGTLMYCAPETLDSIPVNGPEIDVWSLGVCLYVMLSAHFPFSGKNEKDTMEAICTRPAYFIRQQHLPIDVITLLCSMLCKSPRKRITVDELLQHPLLAPYLNTSHKC